MSTQTFTNKVKIFSDGWFYVKVPTKHSNPYLDFVSFITLPAKIRTKEKISTGDEIEVSFKLRKEQT